MSRRRTTHAGLVLADRYSLVEHIATGGMSEVWYATDTRTRTPVAVKILRPELTGDSRVLRRLRMEARNTQRLRHRNLVALLDHGERGGVGFLVQEYVDGENLADLLHREGRLPAARLVPAAANALLASFKIWNTATVGGNICRAFAAGAMVSLSVALDAVAVIWTKDDERRMPVADLVTGNGTTNLGRGDVLRAVEIPTHALASRALLRKIALAEHGRSGAVVTGRVDPDGTSVFTVTAATATPTVLRFALLPTETELADAVASAPGYYTDPLGAADWRRAVSVELASRIRAELA